MVAFQNSIFTYEVLSGRCPNTTCKSTSRRVEIAQSLEGRTVKLHETKVSNTLFRSVNHFVDDVVTMQSNSALSPEPEAPDDLPRVSVVCVSLYGMFRPNRNIVLFPLGA